MMEKQEVPETVKILMVHKMRDLTHPPISDLQLMQQFVIR